MPAAHGPAVPDTRGEHAFFAYDDDTDRAETVVRCVRTGLESGRRVLCTIDGSAPDLLHDVLGRSGMDMSAALESGQLRVVPSDALFLHCLPFDPDQVIPLVRTACAEALADGYTGLTIIGEKSWCAREIPGAERLLEYELRLDREVYADLPVTGLCMFDRRVVPAGTTGLLSGAHHAHAPASDFFEPLPFAVTPLRDRAGARLTGSADLDSRSSLTEALAALTGIPGATLQLDLSRATFLDTEAVAALVDATHRLRRQGRRLLLHEPPYSLRKVAQLFPDECAALEVPS
ncbi:MEDS domain-containing protein [Streptomyces sp. NPDC001691]|uniref:MEDS domain-containing protein n=1 Tax=Streptomyces sp. NPDC001691 TaxID=3364600 RepID=UPI0036CDD395